MNARGFGMVEVLVALLLVTTGLYAALGLALGGLASTGEARRAEVAVALAADLAGRIRMLAAVDWTGLPAPLPCAGACSPAQLAARELADWRATLAASLPEGDAELASGGDDALTLRLAWTDTSGDRRALRLEIAR